MNALGESFVVGLGDGRVNRRLGRAGERDSIRMLFVFDCVENQSGVSELSSSEQSWDDNRNLHEFFFEFRDCGVGWLAVDFGDGFLSYLLPCLRSQ